MTVSTGTGLLSRLVVGPPMGKKGWAVSHPLLEGAVRGAQATCCSHNKLSRVQSSPDLPLTGSHWDFLVHPYHFRACLPFTVTVDLGWAELFSFSFWWPHGSPFFHALANSKAAPQTASLLLCPFPSPCWSSFLQLKIPFCILWEDGQFLLVLLVPLCIMLWISLGLKLFVPCELWCAMRCLVCFLL